MSQPFLNARQSLFSTHDRVEAMYTLLKNENISLMYGWMDCTCKNSLQINMSSMLNVASPIKPEESQKKSIIDFTWNQTFFFETEA